MIYYQSKIAFSGTFAQFLKIGKIATYVEAS